MEETKKCEHCHMTSENAELVKNGTKELPGILAREQRWICPGCIVDKKENTQGTKKHGGVRQRASTLERVHNVFSLCARK